MPAAHWSCHAHICLCSTYATCMSCTMLANARDICCWLMVCCLPCMPEAYMPHGLMVWLPKAVFPNAAHAMPYLRLIFLHATAQGCLLSPSLPPSFSSFLLLLAMAQCSSIRLTQKLACRTCLYMKCSRAAHERDIIYQQHIYDDTCTH